jgi:CheY-like chemotaxis protein
MHVNTALNRLPTARHSDLSGAHCLVIDDSMIDRYLICHTLREVLSGADIVECATLADAFDCLAREKFDLILADRSLPDGDGEVLALEPQQEAAVLILSGEYFPEEEGLDRQEIAFLHKDDLTAQSLARNLKMLKVPTGNGIRMHSPIATHSVQPGFGTDDKASIARGLRLLRTVRSYGSHASADDMSELLREIEQVLSGLDTRLS